MGKGSRPVSAVSGGGEVDGEERHAHHDHEGLEPGVAPSRCGSLVGAEHPVSEEHGDGWLIMADIKRTLDPKNILNPGKVLPS